MQDLILLLLGIITLFFIFTLVRTFLQGYHDGKTQAAHQMILQLAEITHRVEYERREDVTYWFDQDTGQFLAQGKDLGEIVDVLKQRFPKHLFFLPEQKALHAPAWELVDFDWDTTRVIFDGSETKLDR